MEEKNKAWKTVSSKYLFRRPWLTVRCEDMLLPNGNHIPEYYILEYPDWVNTIAMNCGKKRATEKETGKSIW